MDTKAWYQSRTMWGALIMGVCTILQILGVASIGADEQGKLTDGIVNLATAGGDIIGLILVIVGRLKATQPIGPAQ